MREVLIGFIKRFKRYLLLSYGKTRLGLSENASCDSTSSGCRMRTPRDGGLKFGVAEFFHKRNKFTKFHSKLTWWATRRVELTWKWPINNQLILNIGQMNNHLKWNTSWKIMKSVGYLHIDYRWHAIIALLCVLMRLLRSYVNVSIHKHTYICIFHNTRMEYQISCTA